MMDAGQGVTALGGLLIMLLMYSVPLGIVLLPVIMIVRALNRTAAAHESAARALEQIASYMARKA